MSASTKTRRRRGRDLVEDTKGKMDNLPATEILEGEVVDDGTPRVGAVPRAVDPADILFKLSTTAGAAGNSNTSTPAASLGKYISTSQITAATLNNLFDDVSGAESAAGMVDYRCIFVHNADATVSLQNATIAILSETAGGGSIALASDNIAASAIGSASAQAAQIASETTAPSGVSAFGSSATLGTIPAGQCKAVWIRRTVTAGAGAVDPDGVVLRVTGDTGP